jgi:hypothetical protein
LSKLRVLHFIFQKSLETTNINEIKQSYKNMAEYIKINANAVLPVPGAPAIINALPAIFFDLINSTTKPAA